MLLNLYNDNDPYAAAWLASLIARGQIPAGTVDQRSISEIPSHELRQYTQCHFFAGIGGWSRALELANWPSSRSVWTASCPCQPFAQGGKQEGASDGRHLWPYLFGHIRECRPDVIFGEQVAHAVGFRWLDGISADLEAEGYAVGALVLGAHSVGAPHIRQRLYWVADTPSARSLPGPHPGVCSVQESSGTRHVESQRRGDARGMAHPEADGRQGRFKAGEGSNGYVPSGEAGQLGHTDGEGPQQREFAATAHGHGSSPFANGGAWDSFDFLPCTDGTVRRVESGTFPLAHGIPARVVRLRGYGNAIVPEAASLFIQAYLETLEA